MPEHYKKDKDLLRKALNLEGTLIGKHQAAIATLAAIHPHTVVFREIVPQSTCAPFALGFTDIDAYRNIAMSGIFAGKDFMEWLSQNRLTEIHRPTSGCLALYFENDAWKHVGTVTEQGRVISQWGEFPVYEHDVFEVPQTYGGFVRYFTKPVPDDALRLFFEYAKTQGLTDTDIETITAQRR